jgi:arginine decarboxylase
MIIFPEKCQELYLDMTYLQYLKKTYGIKNGVINDYLSIRDNHLYYMDIDLYEVANKYGTPLEMIYPQIIDRRVNDVKRYFREAKKKHAYKGQYRYAYASKANYYEETIHKVLKLGCDLETTSEYDARLALYLKKQKSIKDSQWVLCNGFKLPGYGSVIKELRSLHKNTIPIIENDRDLDVLEDIELPLSVGLRMKIDLKTTKRSSFEKIYNRFGYYASELEVVADRIANKQNFSLKILHVMAGSQIEDAELFKKVLLQALEQYAILKEKNPSLCYLDIGGGLPVQYSLDFKFDYQNFINKLIRDFKRFCKKAGIEEPGIISEFGRYTVSDYASVLFNVEYEKEIKSRKEDWYIVDGSIMTVLPDAWALGQDFLLLPLNGYERKTRNVWLAGITCDSDDVYRGSSKNKPLVLPETDDKLYLGFFGCGSYQANISGIGGVHHCMLPEASELIVEKKKGKNQFNLITRKQSFKRVLKLLDY